MRLPNGERAIVDIRKLRDYCLNPDSPRGRHKARVFAAALGITGAEAARLRATLLEVARTAEVQRGERDLYGHRQGQGRRAGPRADALRGPGQLGPC
jgi:hypothetical protein